MIKNIFSKKVKYNFADPENTACMTCVHVLDGAAVLYVAHDEDDGMWQFLCGASGHESEDAKIVGIGEIAQIDPSVNEISDMPLGCAAERKSKKSDWGPLGA